MSGLPAEDIDYLSLVSSAADQLARLGYLWHPSLVEDAIDDREAKLLAFTPVARRNGFQALLYRAAWDWGYAPIPVLDPHALPAIPWPGRMLCHFHWLNGITRDSPDLRHARSRVTDFEKLLQVLKSQGRNIIWTVHNTLPHDSKWPEEDLSLREIMSKHADLIHIMTAGTWESLKDYYQLPEHKVFLVPHPAYTGFYPDSVTRHEARARLCIPHDAHVFLMFGAIQPYKGYERLIDAFERIALQKRERKPFLIIAGKSSDAQLSRNIRAWALARNDVITVIKPIPNEDIQLYYKAADVAVCPYNSTLNSGAALLALTFGKAVIGPRTGGFTDNVGSACAWLYDPFDRSSRGLLSAMEQSCGSDALQAKSAAAAERSRLLGADTCSNKFFSRLASMGESKLPRKT